MARFSINQVRTVFGSARTRAGKFIADARGVNVKRTSSDIDKIRYGMRRGEGRVTTHVPGRGKQISWTQAKMVEYGKAVKTRTQAIKDQARVKFGLGIGGGFGLGVGSGMAASKFKRKEKPTMYARVPKYLPMEQYNELDNIIEAMLTEFVPLSQIASKGVRSLARTTVKGARRSTTELAREKALLKKGAKVVYSSAKKKKKGVLQRLFASASMSELDGLIEDIAQGNIGVLEE